MTAEEWLAAREPRPPAALAERVRRSLGSSGAPHDPETYLAAAEALLARLLREGCATRESALDLLVADALITYAFEAAADAPTDVPGRAAAAMARIAALAADRSRLAPEPQP